MRQTPVVLALIFAAGCAERSPSTGTSRQEIIGGQLAPSVSEVFLLGMSFDNGVDTICSATLIGRRTLLTAAHCVDPARQGANSVQIRATNVPSADQAQASDFIDAVEAQLHPNWSTTAQVSPFDLALLLLASEPAGVAAKPWNKAPLSGFAGEPLRVLGYGRSDPNTSNGGTRREVSLFADGVDSEYLLLGTSGVEGICSGDSGGPSLHTFPDGVERVVGVHSFQTSAACGDGEDVRIDLHTAFLDAWFAQKEPDLCAADGVCVSSGCVAVDPDCLADGQACTANEQCAGGVCVNDLQRNERYCSRQCGSSSACATGTSCVQGQCLLPPLALPQLGDECTLGQACVAGAVCAAPLGQPTTCRPGCDPDGACLSGAECVSGEGGQSFCMAIVPEEPQEPPPGVSGCAAAGTGPLLGCLLALFWVLGRREKRVL